ncbi:MAG: hypothetical protein ACRDZQ_12250 [Acidimicrobiales bacterium]
MRAEAASAPLPRDAGSWAAKIDRLAVTHRDGVRGTNVAGRRLTSPIQGFGKMWQKTYVCPVGQVAPEEVVSQWREHFAELWPKGNRFAAGLEGIHPGEVALIDMALAPGVPKLSTGVLVLYSDDTSFTFMTPQGHMFAGWITFSAQRGEDGETLAQAQVLLRASDPAYELAMALGGHSQEDRFWEQTLVALATHLGVADPTVRKSRSCVDPKRQWRHWRNLWHNAAVRSALQTVTRLAR